MVDFLENRDWGLGPIPNPQNIRIILILKIIKILKEF